MNFQNKILASIQNNHTIYADKEELVYQFYHQLNKVNDELVKHTWIDYSKIEIESVIDTCQNRFINYSPLFTDK